MGYRKISNLYKNQEILFFKRAYAAEKIHGTSAHVKFKGGKLSFFSGGAPHQKFLSLFDIKQLKTRFEENGRDDITVFGEAYGGKLQKMSKTYGNELKFVAFEVCVSGTWLNVPTAHTVAEKLGFEFVHYVEIPATIEEIDKQRDLPSVQAVRNGITEPQIREGIVLRPLFELVHQDGGRVISKHKNREFLERERQPKIIDPQKIKILEEAREIAREWVTPVRFEHVWDSLRAEDYEKFNILKIELTQFFIKRMVSDIYEEARGEIVESKAARIAIGKETVKIIKFRLNEGLHSLDEESSS